MLNYGEPQILELFKTTLPSRLYYMLYQIDDLTVAVEIAKRLLTTEQIDKQKTGQSPVSPFMKASQQNPKKSEKGVTFGAMETIKDMAIVLHTIIVTVCPRYTGVRPDIWLDLVSWVWRPITS